jgi:hypothetical protein
MTAEAVRAMVESLSDGPAVLARADPTLKREVYADLGLRMIYQPAEELVRVSASPCGPPRVSEGRVDPNVNRRSYGRNRCGRNEASRLLRAIDRTACR